MFSTDVSPDSIQQVGSQCGASPTQLVQGLRYKYPENQMVGAVEVTGHDLLTLRPMEFVNDTIMDYYSKKIAEKYREWFEDDRTNVKLHWFNSFFYKKLTEKCQGTDGDRVCNLPHACMLHASSCSQLTNRPYFMCTSTVAAGVCESSCALFYRLSSRVHVTSPVHVAACELWSRIYTPGGFPPALAVQLRMKSETMCCTGDGGHVQEGVQVDQERGCLCTGLPSHPHPRYCALESGHSVPSRYAVAEIPYLECPLSASVLTLQSTDYPVTYQK